MRLFISINIDNSTVSRIAGVQKRLTRFGNGTFPEPDSFHMTLAFLGEVGESRVADIEALMDSVSVPSMTLRFSHIGCFRGESEIWWLGIDRCFALEKLQSELADKHFCAGFSLEDRRFRPHITLARKMNAGYIGSGKLLTEPFTADVRRISLMLSSCPGGRLRYTELCSKEGKSGVYTK